MISLSLDVVAWHSAMRDQLQSATRIVIKAGTSTVSNEDGTPSLVRLGGIVEAIARLMRDNKQVILVSSGAVGCGRSKLRKQVTHLPAEPRDPEFRRRRCTGRCATT